MTPLWARWRLKSPASRWFAQPFVQAQVEENIKAPLHWSFLRLIRRWPVNSPHKGPVTRKMFPFNDVIMKTWVIVTLGQIMVCCIFGAHRWYRSFFSSLYLKVSTLLVYIALVGGHKRKHIWHMSQFIQLLHDTCWRWAEISHAKKCSGHLTFRYHTNIEQNESS